MNHILGVVGDASREELTGHLYTMQAALGVPERDAWSQIALPGGVLAATRHDMASSLLAGCGVQVLPGGGSIAVADAVLDNRDELLRQWAVASSQQTLCPDDALVFRAWQQWDLQCGEHLLGDWMLGVWDAGTQCLTLIRDHHGNTALFYVQSGRCLAFSSSRQALHALPFVSRALDDLAVACTLTHLNPPGQRTLFRDIAFVPPAHGMRWRQGARRVRQYWYPEDIPLWQGQTEETYAEALVAGIQDAVSRMVSRAQHPGLTLSGGLDSGAVASQAVPALRADAPALAAYCAVPVHDTQRHWPAGSIANEWSLARRIAEHTGIPALHAIRAATVDPLQGIDYMLRVNGEPSVGAGNMYWIADLLDTVEAGGHDLLLTGQQGNGTISWYGRPWSRSFRELARHRSLLVALRHKVVRPLLRHGLVALYNRCVGTREPWLQKTLIQPALAHRVHLQDYVAETAFGLWFQNFHPDPRHYRLQAIEPGTSRVGARWAERGRHHHLRLRDPTASKPLIELCLSIPDSVWSGPRGTDRWLVRQAMQGYLPPEVTDTLSRGRQSSDLFQRLQAIEPRITETLTLLEENRDVTCYLDMARARQTWHTLCQTPFRFQHQQQCLIEIMPALAIGLFLLQEVDASTYQRIMYEPAGQPFKE